MALQTTTRPISSTPCPCSGTRWRPPPPRHTRCRANPSHAPRCAMKARPPHRPPRWSCSGTKVRNDPGVRNRRRQHGCGSIRQRRRTPDTQPARGPMHRRRTPALRERRHRPSRCRPTGTALGGFARIGRSTAGRPTSRPSLPPFPDRTKAAGRRAGPQGVPNRPPDRPFAKERAAEPAPRRSSARRSWRSPWGRRPPR